MEPKLTLEEARNLSPDVVRLIRRVQALKNGRALLVLTREKGRLVDCTVLFQDLKVEKLS